MSREVGAMVYSDEVVLNFTNAGSVLFLDSYVKMVKGYPSLSKAEGKIYISIVLRATTI